MIFIFLLFFSMYKSMKQDLELNLLAGCSSGFSVQVNFVMQAATAILGQTCEVQEIKRCNVNRVQKCVSELYAIQRQVGKTKSPKDVCR